MAPFNKIKDGNVTYTIAGDKMEDLYEFSDQVVERTTNHSVNISTLDPNLYYCAIAWLNAASGYQYRYPVLIFKVLSSNCYLGRQNSLPIFDKAFMYSQTKFFNKLIIICN